MLDSILETVNHNGIIIMIVLIAYFNILIHFKYYRKKNLHDQVINDIFKPKKKWFSFRLK